MVSQHLGMALGVEGVDWPGGNSGGDPGGGTAHNAEGKGVEGEGRDSRDRRNSVL